MASDERLATDERLVWGPLGAGRYAVAIGDEAIGLVRGNEEDGYTARLMDGQPVGRVFDHVHEAARALYWLTRQP